MDLIKKAIVAIPEKMHYKMLQWLNAYIKQKQKKNVDTNQMKLFNPK